jgi:hypothetical protein
MTIPELYRGFRPDQAPAEPSAAESPSFELAQKCQQFQYAF